MPEAFVASGSRCGSLPYRLGDYELIERIGQGGMGVVYKARQLSLDRFVAVKVLLLNTLADITSNGPLPVKQAAQYVRVIAEAVHFAHERGILHRDLKPSNVLIDANDQPRVTDFGLAKRFDDSHLSILNPDLTLSGQVLGSPGFMPPEQASGQRGRVGRRSDVYALGGILYQLLTGRSPFVGENLADILRQVLNQEPLALRLLNPGVPGDLETICLKCLEKEPERRYPTAQILGEELARFLENRPILARPPGHLGKVWRWCRRKPALASLGAGVAILLLAVAIGSPIAMYHINRARLEALDQTERAELNLYAADINLAHRYLRNDKLGQAQELLNRHRPARPDQLLMNATVRKGHEESGSAGGKWYRAKPDLRGWEWQYLYDQSRSDSEHVVEEFPTGGRLSVSGDGRFLAAGLHFGTAYLWDLAKHQRVAGRLGEEGSIGVGFTCLSSDGRFLAHHHMAEGQPPKAVVWDIERQKQHAELRGTNVVGMYPFAFLPQTPGLIVGWIASSGQVRGFTLWDFMTGRILATYESSHRSTDLNCSSDVAFTPDGKRFMTGDADGWVWVWDTTTLELRGAFRAHERPVTGLGLSPDGKILATAQAYVGTKIQLWDFDGLQRDFEQMRDEDFRQLRWGDFKELQRKVEKRPMYELEGHTGWVSDLAFSQTGLLASGAVDHTVRVWDLATRKEKCRFLGQLGEVLSVRFSPDGRRVYSSGLNGRFCAFRVDRAPRQTGPEIRPLQLRGMSPSPDGRRLAMVKQDGTACVLTLGSQNLSEALPELGANNTKILFSADRQQVFVARRSHELGLAELVVWDPDAQPRIKRLDEAIDVRFLERSLDGRVLMAIDWAGEVRVWQTGDWIGHSWRAPWVHCCALSPDGRWLATELGKGLVHVWDTWTGQLLHQLTHGQESARTLAWSPGGRFIAAAAWEGIITVWETTSWREAAQLRAPHLPLALAFSTDGRRLAAGSSVPDAVKIWDTSTWRELFTLEAEAGKLSELIFTADAERLLGRNAAGELLIWSAPPMSQVDDVATDRSR